MDTNILLESGTNELEILEFTVGQNHYGINVAKVREILTYTKPTPVPNAHPYIEGIYMPRDLILSVIDLKRCLNMNDVSVSGTDMYIITNFNKLNIAFHVSGVSGIHRVSWSEIVKPDSTINTAGAGIATGIVKLDGKLIIILDFEKIVAEISPETTLKVSDMEHMTNRTRNDSPILIAEDSPLLLKLVTDCLHKAGYSNIIMEQNGLEAWNKLQELKEAGTVLQDVQCVITDLEMPQMDGHHLLKKIKEDGKLSKIPVVIFSSMVNDEMRRKGESLGADAQLSKPEIGQLVNAIDQLIGIESE